METREKVKKLTYQQCLLMILHLTKSCWNAVMVILQEVLIVNHLRIIYLWRKLQKWYQLLTRNNKCNFKKYRRKKQLRKYKFKSNQPRKWKRVQIGVHNQDKSHLRRKSLSRNLLQRPMIRIRRKNLRWKMPAHKLREVTIRE